MYLMNIPHLIVDSRPTVTDIPCRTKYNNSYC